MSQPEADGNLSDVSDIDDDAAELALKRKLKMQEEEQAKLESQNAELSTEDKEKIFLRRWGQIFFVAPLFPAVLALLTIIWGGIVLNTEPLDCQYPIGTWLSISIVICYVFLFFLTWMYIGPKKFKSFRPIKVGYSLIGGFAFVWYALGTLWWMQSGSCIKSTPALYFCVTASVLVFWLSVLVIAFYGVGIMCKERSDKRRMKEQLRKQQLARKIEREERERKEKEAQAAEQAASRKKADQAAIAQAERNEFYGASSEDEDD